jgi:hypothetical protein
MLILDNVVDTKTLKGCWPQRVPGSVVLLTSRNPAIGRDLVNHRIHLQALGVEATSDLIFSVLDHVPRTQKTLAAAKAIAESLGGLPLAVNQIVGYIYDRVIPLEDFMVHYRTRWKKIQAEDVGLQDYDETLAHVWSMLLQDLKPESRLLQQLLSLLDPDRIPPAILRAKVDELIVARPHLTLLCEDEYE